MATHRDDGELGGAGLELGRELGDADHGRLHAGGRHGNLGSDGSRGEVSVGAAGKERRVTNVAAGLNATDAVNVSQLQSEDAKVNNVSSNVSNLSTTVTTSSSRWRIKYFHANSTLADSSATGTDAVAIGGAASATTANSVALGSNSAIV
ncbi:hypothetical protein ACFFYR_10380 [Paraburkholderia dipogonis]|uniref:hypothetical protein n=1 Tax=Paraburkholderia dipogonis TaxID=1211383 RepID=UPI0035E48592